MASFVPCVAFTLKEEGGFVQNPADPGGATNMGITRATLSDWRGGEVSVDSVRLMGIEEARAIYAAQYWNAVCGKELPSGIDLMLFDHAVNAGVAASAKLVQQLAGVPADGFIGPQTLAAITVHLDGLIARLSDAQRDYYESLRGFAVFGRGWLARVDRRTASANNLVTMEGASS